MNYGILKVSEEVKNTFDASGAKLHISIAGENFIFGNAAIEKSNDVKIAVGKLQSIDENLNISVDSVVIRSETGWFTKGSKGLYRLTVTLSDLSKVNDILGAVMELKNVDMESLEWVYDEYLAKITLIEEAVKRCKAKAELMASLLGEAIVGVRSLSDSYDIPNNIKLFQAEYAPAPSAARNRSFKKSDMVADFGTEVRGKIEISAIATVEFFLANNVLPKDLAVPTNII
jgi:small nuclear ribonucleoprotein (snRNP)-like protein